MSNELEGKPPISGKSIAEDKVPGLLETGLAEPQEVYPTFNLHISLGKHLGLHV